MDVDMCELEVAPPVADVALTPSDRWSLYIYADVTSFFIEILREVKRHLTTAAPDI
jgi:hypothetical protein